MLIQTEKRAKGIITGFSALSYNDLTLKSAEMGLHMPAYLLQQIADYAKSHNKQNMSYDELYFLDTLYTSKANYPENKIIESFSTNTKYISDTHTDVINKRSELGKDKSSPVTLISYLSLAGEYLYKCKKRSPLSSDEGISVETDPLIRSCHGLSVKTNTSASSLNSFGFSHFGTYAKTKVCMKKPECGDIIALIIPHDGETIEEFQSNCIKFIGNSSAKNMLYNLSVVPEDGLTEIILKYPMGVDINVAKYPLGVSDMCYADYAVSCGGALCCLIKSSDIKVISSIAKKSNVRIFALGSVASSGNVTISDKNELITQIDKNEIELVISYLQNSTVIIEDDNPSAAVSSLLPPITSMGESKSLLIEDSSDAYYSCGDIITSVCGCSLLENQFSASMQTVLCSVEKLVCAGISRNDIIISCDILFDKHSDTASISRNCSTALGIYRAQTELSLLSSGSKIRFENNDCSKLAVYASAKAVNAPTPAVFTSTESNVYLLTPQIKEDGLPDFVNYRDMLDYINKLYKDGSILCAGAVCNGNINDTLNSMCSRNISFNPDENIDVGKLPYLYSVIIETKEKINGIYIGKTCEGLFDTKSDKPSATNQNETCKKEQKCISKIYYPAPSVIIASFDGEASKVDIISEMFKNAGASAKIINTSLCRHDLDMLSLAIRSSCICVFIGDKNMIFSALADVRVGYAVNENSADDKLIISYGRSASETVSEYMNLKLPIGNYETETTSTNPILVSSADIDSPFSQIKYSYTCKSFIGGLDMIRTNLQPTNAIVKALYDNNTYYDGFVSEDGHYAAFISLLTSENVKSAVEYFK